MRAAVLRGKRFGVAHAANDWLPFCVWVGVWNAELLAELKKGAYERRNKGSKDL